jgi:hypothetical protein
MLSRVVPSAAVAVGDAQTEHLSRSIRFLSLLVKMERYKFPAAHKKVFRAPFSLFKRERKTRESKKL